MMRKNCVYTFPGAAGQKAPETTGTTVTVIVLAGKKKKKEGADLITLRKTNSFVTVFNLIEL